MKIRLFFVSLMCVAMGLHVMAQDPVIMNIGGDDITRSEFEKVFRKNNTKDAKVTRKDVNEYVDLFINYKLKVKEALQMQMDTVSSFRTELAGYRKQLAQPYLVDKSVTDSLLREAYERLKTEIRASHILVKCAPDALPKDTLDAYNKAMKIRGDLLKGADFASLAREVSGDPSAKDNGGDLGYFTALQMVYPFESACYRTPVGQVSMPVRTRFGYHIIKVTATRPAQGEVRVAHIMVKSPAGSKPEDSAAAVAKINEIYGKLKAGENFESLARQFSDDQSSARNGGTLPMFGTGRMVPEFEKAAFALKEVGDYSAPVQTSYGWHIIKLLEKKPIGTYEELLPEIKAKVSKDSRSELSRASMVQRIQKRYGYKEFPKALAEFMKTVDSSLAEGKWSADKAAKLNSTLFILGVDTFRQKDFAAYVASHQSKRSGASPRLLANDLYNEWTAETTIAFEEARLDDNYPEFKSLMQEYRDGILLFELTDEKVWSKAVRDTAGLEAYYEKNKASYMWPERVDAVVYSCSSADVARQVRKMLKKSLSPDSISKVLNKASQLSLQVTQGKFARGENEFTDSVTWVAGIAPDMQRGNQVVVVDIRKVLKPEPKTLDEARGLITSDYQNFLEKEWIAGLREKYPVTVNQSVVDSIAD